MVSKSQSTDPKGIKGEKKIMKKIIGILLVGLLGFLGCSDNDDATNTVGEAITVAPFGIVETSTPTYEWTPVPRATKYRLLVQDTNEVATIQDSNETSIIDQWYTAEEAGCDSEESLCMVTPDIEVFEENEFRVLACANEECGQWSELLKFDFSVINGPRFIEIRDGIVMDNYTKVVWLKDAGQYDHKKWNDAWNYCGTIDLGHPYNSWSLPLISELRSLVDKNHLAPALPSHHPFKNLRFPMTYWSGSEVMDTYEDFYYAVDFYTGTTYEHVEYDYLNTWCRWWK